MANPKAGAIYSAVGASIKNAYDGTTTVSTTQNIGRAGRVRYYLEATLSGGTSITAFNVKLEHRYNDGANQGTWNPLPSYLDDVQGAAQPKGPTWETEHTATVSSSAATLTFYLDKPLALMDVRAQVKANAAGTSTDAVALYQNWELGP